MDLNFKNKVASCYDIIFAIKSDNFLFDWHCGHLCKEVSFRYLFFNHSCFDDMSTANGFEFQKQSCLMLWYNICYHMR